MKTPDLITGYGERVREATRDLFSVDRRDALRAAEKAISDLVQRTKNTEVATWPR
ncbi:MAG: hypothetical protein HYV09_26525 [Deltaproteobacteria bacterium]|nr:hypothetical protein [Deltaproteobacteria bacterium]